MDQGNSGANSSDTATNLLLTITTQTKTSKKKKTFYGEVVDCGAVDDAAEVETDSQP
jgi:hypothetical protein